MGLDTPEICTAWRNVLRISCASSWFFTRSYQNWAKHILRKCRVLFISATVAVYSLDWTYETIILQMGAKPCIFRKKEQIYKASKAKFVYSELNILSFGNVDKVRFERNMVRIVMGRLLQIPRRWKKNNFISWRWEMGGTVSVGASGRIWYRSCWIIIFCWLLIRYIILDKQLLISAIFDDI